MKVVTTSMIGFLSKTLSDKLGREVVVARNDSVAQPVKYYLKIGGEFPQTFGPCSVHEIKARMAMIEDMLSSKVIIKGDGNVNTPNPTKSTPRTTTETYH